MVTILSPARMRRLKIKLLDLEGAFDASFMESHHYFDTQTGEVLLVMDESRDELQQLSEEEDADEALADLVRKSTLPEWQKDALAVA
jgi:hypothetical protein